jgi:hypothetical protein
MPTLTSMTQRHPRERARSSSQLRAMPAPSTPEAQALIDQAAVQRAESSASRIRQQGSARDGGGAQAPEASVHAGGAAGQPANQGRTPVRERILDARKQAQDGDARNVINARRTSNTEARVVVGYHPRRGGCYDSREDRSPTPEPPGTRVFSREIRTASFPQHFRQPTSIDKYTGGQTLMCGSTTTAWRASWAAPPPTWSSSTTCRCTSRTRPGRGSNTCHPARSITGTTCCARSWGTSRARTCALGTPGT